MVSSELVERNRLATRTLSDLVLDQLRQFFGALDLSRPEAARDALLEYTPALVAQYGQVSAELAVEAYEEMRLEAGAAGAFRALAAPLPDLSGATASAVRFAAGHLFTPDPQQALGTLSGDVDKYVKQPGRQTLTWNADREGVGWARIPKGPRTCAFCLLLASRSSQGALYYSRRSAGDAEGHGVGDDFHDHCNCQVVRIASPADYPPGFDPDELYDLYETSANKAGTRGDINAILHDMRRRFPDRFTDGVDDPEYMEQHA